MQLTHSPASAGDERPSSGTVQQQITQAPTKPTHTVSFGPHVPGVVAPADDQLRLRDNDRT
jgi:hypothetical protein